MIRRLGQIQLYLNQVFCTTIQDNYQQKSFPRGQSIINQKIKGLLISLLYVKTYDFQYKKLCMPPYVVYIPIEQDV